MSKHKTLVFETRAAEIQQQASPETCRLEVVQYLGLLDTSDRLQRFQLDDHIVVTDKIRTIGAGQQLTLIINRQLNFTCKLNGSG